jgi:excinuclease ABC subunit C
MEPRQKIGELPQKPGVYLMKDDSSTVLYVGKAKNLRKRISSYFHRTVEDAKTRALIANIRDIDTIITDNETEALILENNLIKQYKPKYNIELKENNQYPYLKITDETYPRILKTRIRAADGALYFGPYTRVKDLNRTIKSITDIFPLRRCAVNLDKNPRNTPCINYPLKKCACPCCGRIDRETYQEMVRQVVLFLKGQSGSLLARLKEEMDQESERQNFERAIELRERYRAIEHLLSEQKITSLKGENEDILGVSFENHSYAFTVLKRRDGRIIGKNDYTVHDSAGFGDVLEQFLLLYYEDTVDLPDAILLPLPADAPDTLRRYFQRRFGKNIRVYVPQKGLKRRLVELACRNAEQFRKEAIHRIVPSRALKELKHRLDLEGEPSRIEAFDISTTLGTFSVASMVRFTHGKPDKAQYRKFRIRYTGQQNDVEMIREAVARRYQRLLNEEKPLPDLIVVDGGQQQVNGAREVLDLLGQQGVPLIGLAKKHEEVWLSGKHTPLRLERSNEGLRLLMAIRDEAHRFANTYHVSLRSKSALISKLKTVPGIGDTLSAAILSALQSNKDVTMESLLSVRGLGENKAAQVYRLLVE